MKRILIVAVLFILSISLFGEESGTDRQKAGLSGAVKVWVMTCYDEKGVAYISNRITFDTYGNKVIEEVFQPDGTIKEKKTYKYDGWGNVIEETVFSLELGMTMKFTYKYQYWE